MISWQVLWFSDFVGFLQNLKTTRPQVRSHVSWKRCSKLVVCSWIRPHIILNNMNIIFPFIFSLFEWLAVIIWIIKENSIKWNKLKKYRKSPRNVPHWNMEYQVLYEDYRKSLGAGRKKIKMVCRVSTFGARQRSLFVECQDKTLGKGSSLPSVRIHSTKD